MSWLKRANIAPQYTGTENPGGEWSDVDQRIHELDPGIGWVVQALRQLGYSTHGSCSGMAQDHAGREKETDVILPNGVVEQNAYHPYITINGPNLQFVAQVAQQAGLKAEPNPKGLKVSHDNGPNFDRWKQQGVGSRFPNEREVTAKWERFIMGLTKAQAPRGYVS